MFVFYLYQFAPALVGLAVAIGAGVLLRRSAIELPGRVRLITGVGMLLVISLYFLARGWGVIPFWIIPGADGSLAFQLTIFVAPLALTVIAVILLALPIPVAGPRGSAALVPRTPVSFAPRRWLGIGAGTTLAVVAVALAAGSASIPDEFGRYVMYEVRASRNTSGGTSIYGWWFSVPCLILVAVIVALALLALTLISRPALGIDGEQDAHVRRVRVRNVLITTTGGLLLHLGAVLTSLYGTSTMRTGFDAGDVGFVSLGTSFAAIGPALQVLGFIATALGVAAWCFVLFSAVTVRARQRSVPVSL